MLKIIPTGESLGATIEGADLAKPLGPRDFAAILRALGEYSVLRFPAQRLDGAQLKAFAGRFGALEINVAGTFQEPGHPEVMILSNIVENGRPIGARDAGQDWHTDMSYSETIALANLLYGLKVPRRDGVALGGTEFANMHAAYAALPEELRTRLDGMTVLHDFTKFWEMMRQRPGSWRPPLSEEQRKQKPPVSHPIFLVHPITGKKVLYANPGYAIRINELPERESDDILALKSTKSEFYNLGTGGGSSVREVIAACREITGRKIDIVEKPRRPGDPPRLIASSEKIKRELGWRPQFQSLEAIIESAWKWHEKFPDGYAD